MKRKVTLRDLAKLNACEEQRELFEEVFPNGTTITALHVKQASRANLDVGWLMQTALTDAQYRRYSAQDNKLWAQCYESKDMPYSQYENAHFALMAKFLQNHWKAR